MEAGKRALVLRVVLLVAVVFLCGCTASGGRGPYYEEQNGSQKFGLWQADAPAKACPGDACGE